MSSGSGSIPIPILSSLGRTARLTWIEIIKLVAQKFYPVSLLVSVLATVGLGLAGKHFSEGGATAKFSNYSLWVVTASFSLQVGVILLVAQGAMAMSSEATARTLNTILTRPVRRLEFAVAKALSLVFATVTIIAAIALTSYILGGTVEDRPGPRRVVINTAGDTKLEERSAGFPSYGDVVDPLYPDTIIARKSEVMGNILLGFLLLVVPVLAAASLSFLLGTVLDSSALATGLAVGFFVALEATKFFPLFEEKLGRFAYNYPITRIFTLMLNAGKGSPPVWDEALAGVAVSAIYVGVSLLISFAVFCRRDVTL